MQISHHFFGGVPRGPENKKKYTKKSTLQMPSVLAKVRFWDPQGSGPLKMVKNGQNGDRSESEISKTGNFSSLKNTINRQEK